MAVKHLTGYYQNVRGLRTKSQMFFRQVALSNYDLILITESWLTPDFYDHEYFDSRYSVFRCDRSNVDSGAELGGGSMVAVRSDLRALRRDWPVPSAAGCECVWVSIPIIKNNNYDLVTHLTSAERAIPNQINYLNIACVYIPQSKYFKECSKSFFDICCQLVNDRPNDEFLITGDFNVAKAKWILSQDNNMSLLTSNSEHILRITDFMSFTNLNQYNSIPNEQGRFLDLVFCSSACHITSSHNSLVPEDVYHRSLLIDIKIVSQPALKSSQKYVFNFYKGDFDEISNSLSSINWQSKFKGLNTEQTMKCFYDILNNLILKYIPKRRCHSSSLPAWYSAPLRKLLKEKRKYHKLWKLYGNPLDYDTFRLLRKRADKMEAECYRNFIRYTEEKIRSNPKYFWSYIRMIKGKNDMPDTMTYKNVSSTDGQEICNLFSDHFYSVFENYSECYNVEANPCYRPANTSIDIHRVNLTENLVLKHFKSINVHKGAGPDGVHPLLIKECAIALATPLTIIYSKSLAEGCMPQVWKHAYITPVPKGQVSRNIEDYRPISKLCQFGKILEKIVTSELSYSVRHEIIRNQHGFYKGRSVDTNLLEFSNDILKSMDKGHAVDAVYTDFAKAFDKICHSVLLEKLWRLGIHGDLFRWIKSYIENRSQSVVLLGNSSDHKTVSSGVPQGSHLGPLLFSIYINDVLKSFKSSNALLYADDTKIYREIKSVNDCHLLQEDLNRFVEYCNINKLFLNPNKCYVISFSRKKRKVEFNYELNNFPLQRVSQIRDLGVVMDSEMTFLPHIDKIVKQCYKTLGFVMRVTKPFSSTTTLKVLYNSYVRSRLEFACTVWKPYSAIHIQRLERIQKKVIKSLDYRAGFIYSDYTESLKRHRMVTLELRRDCVDVVLLYKIIHQYVDASPLLQEICFRVPRKVERSCRSRELFFIPRSKTNYARNAFLKRACKLFNTSVKLGDTDIFQCSLASLKNNFRQVT